MDRIVSVSTMAFDGYSLEVALDELAALGVKYVEPASVDKIFQHLVEADFCDSRAMWLRNQLSARRLSCLSLSAHMDLTGSDAVERFHRRLEFAQNIGARCVNSIAGPTGKLEGFRKNISAIADRARDLEGSSSARAKRSRRTFAAQDCTITAGFGLVGESRSSRESVPPAVAPIWPR
jgi:sugar phosphate isomerase/epimerase